MSSSSDRIRSRNLCASVEIASAGSVALRSPIVTRSFLLADHATAWDTITSMRGINYELGPVLGMTAPRRLRDSGLAEVVIGERLCRSWVLVFGVLPIDYDDITIVRLRPQEGFLERSSMLWQRCWEHERTLEAASGGCVITDRIRYEPRVPLPDALLRPMFVRVFRHRHRRLRRRYGGRTLPDLTT